MTTPPPLEFQDGPREPNTGRTFREKLGIYLTGIAIGLMLFGWFQYRKGIAVRQQRAQRAAQIESTTPQIESPPAIVEDETPG